MSKYRKKIKKTKYYSLYKGENEIAFGTLKQIASKLGIDIDSVKYYRTQAYQNKLNKRINKGKNARVLVKV